MISRYLKEYLPGLSVAFLVTVCAVLLHGLEFFQKRIPLSPLIIAIIAGMIVNNVFKLPVSTRAGTSLAAKKILRAAIVLLGFRLSMSQVLDAGPSAIMVVTVSTTATILFTIWLGTKMGLPVKRAMILASGVSVCGASAVAAVEGVIQADKEDTAFAIGTVTLLGTVYMILYPLIYSSFHLSDLNFALWSGSSIHEVAQVAAAASSIKNPGMEALASTVKMMRVLLIIPLTLVLLVFDWSGNEGSKEEKGPERKKKISVPWFAILFFIVVIINSLPIVPEGAVKVIQTGEKWLMTCAMAGLGLGIAFKELIKIGKKAFILGLFSSLFISLLSASVLMLRDMF